MTATPGEGKRDSVFPELYPFIIVRRENFGSLVFNACLSAEQKLDPVETEMILRMNGGSSLRQIREAVAAGRGMPMDQIASRAELLLDKLSAMTAVRMNPQPGKGLPVGPVPETTFPSSCLTFPKSVLWDVTYACNLRCDHCLTDSGTAAAGELDTAQALSLINRLEEAKLLRVALMGGEPFLRPDLLELMERISQTPMGMEISTNGVEIPEVFFERLDELKLFNVQVSLDGVGSRHDAFRGRAGAFAAATRTIGRLRAAGIEVGISTTATAVNLDQVPAIIDFARSLDCRNYKAIAFLPAGRGRRNQDRLRLSPEQHLELCRILMKKREELAGVMDVSLGTTRAYLLETRGPAASAAVPDEKVTCSAGNDVLNIGADGTLYPCPFLRDFPLGHALRDSIQDIWFHSPVLNRLRNFKVRDLPENCRGCDAIRRCRGGCRAAAFLEHGDLAGMDPSCFRHLCTPRTSDKIAAGCGG